MSCASELSCCELEAALPTSASAMECGASHADGPRAGWHLTACVVLAPPVGWSLRSLVLNSKVLPAWQISLPTACFVYSGTFPAKPPVFMLMFLFGDIHLSRESLSLPQLHLAAVLVAVPHCHVLPEIPSQDGWRLPGTPASLLLLCASIPTRLREQRTGQQWSSFGC